MLDLRTGIIAMDIDYVRLPIAAMGIVASGNTGIIIDRHYCDPH
jgi:hypothetical protein